MKTRYKIALLIVALAFATMPLLLFAQDPTTNAPIATNAVTTMDLPSPLAPIINLLPVNLRVLAVKILVWSASMSALLVWFRTRIDHWLRDRMNAAAEANGGGDAWLRSIYGSVWYRAIATVLAFVSINLPSVSELDRSVKMQQQAVAESKANPGS